VLSMFMCRLILYHFKIFIIEWNNVYTLKHGEIPLDMLFFFVFGATAPSGPGPPHSRNFLDHTKLRTTVGRTPLDE